jgi:hypothetical protein
MQRTFSGEVNYTGDMSCEITGPQHPQIDVYDLFYIWSADGYVGIEIWLEGIVADYVFRTPVNYVAVGMY